MSSSTSSEVSSKKSPSTTSAPTLHTTSTDINHHYSSSSSSPTNHKQHYNQNTNDMVLTTTSPDDSLVMVSTPKDVSTTLNHEEDGSLHIPTLKIKENENMTTLNHDGKGKSTRNTNVEQELKKNRTTTTTTALKMHEKSSTSSSNTAVYLFKQYIIYGVVVGLSVLITFGLYFLYIHDGVWNGTAEASTGLKKALLTSDEEEEYTSPTNLLSLGRTELSQLYRPVPASIAKYIKPLEPKTRIIGRREMIHFPQLGVMNLLGKVDSGAKTSCLDVVNVHHDKVKKTLNFDVVLDRNNRSIVQQILDFPFANTTKTVMSSNGHVSTRYVIKTLVSIGPEFQQQVAEFTLVERHKLACPVLIGRNVIRMGGFLVDCNKKFVTGKKAKPKVQEPIHIPNVHEFPIIEPVDPPEDDQPQTPPKKKGKKIKKKKGNN